MDQAEYTEIGIGSTIVHPLSRRAQHMVRKIGAIAAALFSQNVDWKRALMNDWPIVMARLSTRVQLEKIIGEDTLVLGVYDSCWLQELHLLSDQLIGTINRHLGVPRIKKLKFRRAPSPRRVQRVPSPVPVPAHKASPMRVPMNVAEERLLARLSDRELGEALLLFRDRCRETCHE